MEEVSTSVAQVTTSSGEIAESVSEVSNKNENIFMETERNLVRAKKLLELVDQIKLE